jgi:biopolymer transport protein ExbB/TolQ
MSLLSSIFNLFFKSDFFSKLLVISLFIFGIVVLFLFFYGALRFYYKKNEIIFILNKCKDNQVIIGNENNFSALLIHALKKSNHDSLFNVLITAFLGTELKIKSVFGIAAVISPLLGLLGTIWGIMHVFLNLGNSGADLAAIAPGIAEALITTLAGLFVAIPGLIAYHIFAYFIKSYLILAQVAYEEMIIKKKSEGK